MTRPLTARESNRIKKQRAGEWPVEVAVAVEALVIAVPVALPVQDISLARLRRLYQAPPDRLNQVFPELSGKVGQLKPVVLGLNSAGERYRWFKTQVLQGADFGSRVLETRGPLQMVDRLAASKAGFAYARPAELTVGVRSLGIVPGEKGTAVPFSEQSLKNGRYPLQRTYYFRLPGGKTRLDPKTIQFLRTVLSPAGQALLRPQGLFPLSAAARAVSLRALERISAR